MDSSRVYNFTHGSDMDGMSSAAFLVRYYKVPLENVFFVNYSGEQFKTMIDFLENFPDGGRLLIISDFGVNKSTFDRFRKALAIFEEKGNSIIWFDHHPWSDEQIKRMSDLCDFMVVGENHNSCGAELVYRFLCPHDKKADEIARITHLADFDPRLIKSKRDKHIVDQMGTAINYLKGDGADSFDSDKLRKIVSCIAEGELENKYIVSAAKKYRKRAEPQLKKMLKSAEMIREKGFKISVGFANHVQHQDACMRMFKTGADVVIFSAPSSGNTSVRSLHGVVSSKISFAFGGGGHPQASGFSVKRKEFDLTKKKGRKKFVEEIRKSVKNGAVSRA